MAGLIEKDLRILGKRSQSLLFLAVISLVMAFTQNSEFVIGYVTLLASIFAVGTISYDEFDNGYLFLMTLPIDAKTYVFSKYILGTVFGFGAWLFSLGLGFVADTIKGIHSISLAYIAGAAAFLGVFILINDLMIPVQIKYGAEKSRLVVAGLGAMIMAVGYFALSKIDQTALAKFENSISPEMAAAAGIVLVLALTVISVWISIRIVEHKEF